MCHAGVFQLSLQFLNEDYTVCATADWEILVFVIWTRCQRKKLRLKQDGML
jgi:hypothetical protein